MRERNLKTVESRNVKKIEEKIFHFDRKNYSAELFLQQRIYKKCILNEMFARSTTNQIILPTSYTSEDAIKFQ